MRTNEIIGSAIEVHRYLGPDCRNHLMNNASAQRSSEQIRIKSLCASVSLWFSS
jgi:hypothetical protein